jgi:peptidoglycan/LPS O-acetylase OafA/YrhL
MALFFVLSGFLITSFLQYDQDIKKFLVRRIARILPLAWLYLLIIFLIVPASLSTLASHFLFYGNISLNIVPSASHFWSLCLEVQFYFWIAALVHFFKSKSFYLIPFACVLVTLNSIFDGTIVNIQTQYRADEILSGCLLSLVFHGKYGDEIRNLVGKISPVFLILVFVLSCMPQTEWFNYFRPYLAALLVGSTIINHDRKINFLLKIKSFEYIATVSFALYVIHGGLRHTWLGTGETIEKYLKRPLLFLITFGLAHYSTFKFEIPITNWAKKYKSKVQKAI